MARVSKELMNEVFARYCKAMRKRVAKPWDPKKGADVGGWHIEHRGSGHVQIAQYADKSGNVIHPFGETQYMPSDLVAVMRFATESIKAR